MPIQPTPKRLENGTFSAARPTGQRPPRRERRCSGSRPLHEFRPRFLKRMGPQRQGLAGPQGNAQRGHGQVGVARCRAPGPAHGREVRPCRPERRQDPRRRDPSQSLARVGALAPGSGRAGDRRTDPAYPTATFMSRAREACQDTISRSVQFMRATPSNGRNGAVHLAAGARRALAGGLAGVRSGFDAPQLDPAYAGPAPRAKHRMNPTWVGQAGL